MNAQVHMFCERLSCLDVEQYLKSGDFGASDLELALYDLSDMVEGEELGDVLPKIFAFYEKHPHIEQGNLGPLANLVENSGTDYIPPLLTSIQSKPTYVTVNLLARVINSDVSEADRERFISIIKKLASDDSIDTFARATAKEYIEHKALTWGAEQVSHR